MRGCLVLPCQLVYYRVRKSIRYSKEEGNAETTLQPLPPSPFTSTTITNTTTSKSIHYYHHRPHYKKSLPPSPLSSQFLTHEHPEGKTWVLESFLVGILQSLTTSYILCLHHLHSHLPHYILHTSQRLVNTIRLKFQDLVRWIDRYIYSHRKVDR